MSQESSTTPGTKGDAPMASPSNSSDNPKPENKNSGNLGETIKQVQERHQSSSASEQREEQAEMQDAKDEERERLRLRDRRNELWDCTKVPKLHMTTPPYTDAQKGYINRVIDSRGKGAVWVLLGDWGTGKTQVAVAVLRRACHNLWSSSFTTAIEFFIKLRSPYNDGPSNEQAVINDLVRPEFLVIDDAHIRHNSDYEIQMFHHVIDKRHKELKTTILTSNQSVKVFSDTIGGAIVDRMIAAGGIIELKGESFRGKEQT